MRRVLVCLAVVAVVLAVPALAVEKHMTADKSMTVEKSTAPEKGPRPMFNSARGEVVKWDASAKTFTVKDAKGTEESFVWNEKTKLVGAPKVGEHVVVHFVKEGDKSLAQRIAVPMTRTAKAAPPARAPKKH
jgi:hypothetical protein